jgi:hypothetical protein
MLQHLADRPEAIVTRARAQEHYSPFGTEDTLKSRARLLGAVRCVFGKLAGDDNDSL